MCITTSIIFLDDITGVADLVILAGGSWKAAWAAELSVWGESWPPSIFSF
jgi:hypothetical protein